jgi:hypothetical protein
MRSGFNMKLLALPLALAIGGSFVSTVQAVEINCPGTPISWDPSTWDREFTLTTPNAATCSGSGVDTFNDAAYVAAGWAKIDKTNDSGGTYNGSLSAGGLGSEDGWFAINNSAWNNAYSSVLLVLQGGGYGFFGLASNPDWAAFTLAGGTSGGQWSVSTDKVSSISIYGRTAAVPEPATLGLFGAGLLGLAIMRRRQAA